MENASAPKPPWRSKPSGLSGSRVKLATGTQETHSRVADKSSRFFASFETPHPQSTENTAGNCNAKRPPAGSFAAPSTLGQCSLAVSAGPQGGIDCQPSAACVNKTNSCSTAMRLGDLTGLADLLDLPSGGVSLPANSAAPAAGARSTQTAQLSSDLSEQAPDQAPAKKGFAAAQRRGHTNLLRASFTKRPIQVAPCHFMSA